MSVPALRFKQDDGRDFPAWSISQLGQVADFLDGRRKPVKESDRAKIKGIYPYYGASGIIDYVNDYIFDEDIILLGEDGENIVSRKLPLAFKVSGKCWVNNHAHVFKPKESTNIDFLTQYLDSISYLEYNSGTAQPKLNQEVCKKIPVPTPHIKEQTKIANFLTAVDEKIQQLNQKHDLLTQYKKGVMQQIFSQKLRFKDDEGQDFSEWEERKLGDIFTFIQTNSFSRELLNYETGVVKNIHYGDIHTKFKSNFKIENANVPFIKPNVDLSKISTDCYCREGDLIIADASEDYADVGKAIEIISLVNQKLLSGLHTYIARDLSKQMSLGFSGYMMQTDNVRLQIKTFATGASVLGISKGNLAKVNLNIPSKPEQTKIANFLTGIDDKITATQTQLQAVKQYKQGLLQQMFV